MNDLIEILIIKERANLTKEQLFFSKVLDETITSIQSLVEENDVQIVTEFSAQPMVLYHKDYLKSLFYNLITNSIRFKQPFSHPHITIYTKQVKGRTVLTYTDNGLGFDLNRVGDKVFGLHQHFHKHPDSRGLGLYLIKTQLMALGGTVELTSSPNEGSTFTITF
jgi:light-regulated signal transduction histidine kinase (bacteriophytochrome)